MFKTVNGIDVFEVGYQQVRDWIDSGALENPCWADYPICKGDYAIAYVSAIFGGIGISSVWTGYFTLEDALEKVPASYSIPEEGGYAWELGFRHGLARHVEIWHIVDDGDLWQVWDHDATEYQRRMSGYYGIRCMACNDEYGPWVTVFTVGGGRGYLCEECFDRYNLINSFVGRIRLECL